MKTECSIVKDLLPLYVEDMLRMETVQYIDEHIQQCPDCNAELGKLKQCEILLPIKKESIETTDKSQPFKRMMKRMNRQFYGFAYSLIIFFVFLGFGWTGGDNLMYNSFIMPIVGVFGYYVFKWKAIYKMPVVLLLIDLAVFAFQLVELSFFETLMWTMLYSVFVLIGVVIAFLLHYAFKKEENK